MPNIPKRKNRPWLAKSDKPKDWHSDQGKERNAFYQTTRWRKLRAMFIKQHPLCVQCNGVGEVVDHITPIRLGGDEMSWDNLQTMCHSCHNSKSAKERWEKAPRP